MRYCECKLPHLERGGGMECLECARPIRCRYCEKQAQTFMVPDYFYCYDSQCVSQAHTDCAATLGSGAASPYLVEGLARHLYREQVPPVVRKSGGKQTHTCPRCGGTGVVTEAVEEPATQSPPVNRRDLCE